MKNRSVSERAAYLRGLMDGADLGKSGKEKQVWDELLGILEQVGEELERQREGQEALGAELDDVVAEVFGTGYLGEKEDESVREEEDGEAEVIEVECPHCHKVMPVDEDVIPADEEEELELTCDACGHDFYIGYGDLPEKCACGGKNRK